MSFRAMRTPKQMQCVFLYDTKELCVDSCANPMDISDYILSLWYFEPNFLLPEKGPPLAQILKLGRLSVRKRRTRPKFLLKPP